LATRQFSDLGNVVGRVTETSRAQLEVTQQQTTVWKNVGPALNYLQRNIRDATTAAFGFARGLLPIPTTLAGLVVKPSQPARSWASPGYGDTPAKEHVPAGTEARIMHARIVLGDQVLMGCDAHPDTPYEGVKGCDVADQVGTADEPPGRRRRAQEERE